MKANVFLATALTALSSAVLAAGPSTVNQTQSVASGVSGSVLVGSGSYTSNSTSVAGASAGGTVTPSGSTGTASAFHNSTSTASGWGTNGGAYAAGGATLLELLDARRAHAEALATSLRWGVEVRLARLDLNRAIGAPLLESLETP